MCLIDITEERLKELLRAGWTLQPRRRGEPYLVPPIPAPRNIFSRAVIHLYVIHATNTERFKIGIAGQPGQRLRDLQVGSPVILELVNAVEIETPEVEIKAHRLLARWHKRAISAALDTFARATLKNFR